MKKTLLLKMLTMCFLIVSISSCSKDDDPINNNPNGNTYTVPSKIGIIPPKSADENDNVAIASKSTKTNDFGAYGMLQDDIRTVKRSMGNAKAEMMLLGKIFDEAMGITDGKSGSVPANTFKVTVTQAMKDTIENISDWSSFGEDEENKVDIPKLDITVYGSDSEGGGYKYEVTYNRAIHLSYDDYAYITTLIKWNSDESKVYIKRLDSTDMTTDPVMQVTSNDVSISEYNALENKMDLRIVRKGIQSMNPKYCLDFYEASMKETGQGNNEIYLDSRSGGIFVLEASFPGSNEVQGGTADLYHKLGRLDDTSGEIKMNSYFRDGVPSVEETFDGNGNILSHRESEDGINWTGDVVSNDFDTYVLASPSPNITLSGFTPTDDKIYPFVITTENAPSYSSDFAGFMPSIIGYVIYEKSADTDAVISSFNWEPLNSVEVYEHNSIPDANGRPVSEYNRRSVTVSEN